MCVQLMFNLIICSDHEVTNSKISGSDTVMFYVFQIKCLNCNCFSSLFLAVTVSFTQPFYTVNEGNGNFLATLSLSTTPATEVIVLVVANGGTATGKYYNYYDPDLYHTVSGNGTDFFPGQVTATFSAGVATAQITFTIVNDNILEDDETFDIAIDQSTLPDGVVVVDPSLVTVTIVNDDGESYRC